MFQQLILWSVSRKWNVDLACGLQESSHKWKFQRAALSTVWSQSVTTLQWKKKEERKSYGAYAVLYKGEGIIDLYIGVWIYGCLRNLLGGSSEKFSGIFISWHAGSLIFCIFFSLKLFSSSIYQPELFLFNCLECSCCPFPSWEVVCLQMYNYVAFVVHPLPFCRNIKFLEECFYCVFFLFHIKLLNWNDYNCACNFLNIMVARYF